MLHSLPSLLPGNSTVYPSIASQFATHTGQIATELKKFGANLCIHSPCIFTNNLTKASKIAKTAAPSYALLQ